MSKLLDALARLLFLAGVIVAALVLGAWLAWREAPPFAKLLRPSFIGVDALLSGDADDDDDDAPGTAGSPGPGPRGVLTLDAQRASAGLTLVVAGQGARLIELDGTVRHRWELPYERLLGPGALRDHSPPETKLYWRPARALPNGDLLAVVDEHRASPEGLAIVRMDRDSRPLWVLHEHVHHDFDIAPDGRIFVLGMGVRADPPRALRKLVGPLLEERLLVLSPAGRPLEEVSILEAFVGTPYEALLERTAGERRYRKGDYLHSNNVDVVTAAVAARFPFAAEGQVLLSLREISTLALLDVGRRRIVWARHDEWEMQHDPDFLDNGHLLIFDNRGDYRRGGSSRVIEYEPLTGAIVWEYPGPAGPKLWSGIRGDQQRLPNGNTLINEFAQARLLEVTPGREVVWEYRCDFPGAWKPRKGCAAMSTERYAPGALSFALNEGELAEP